MWPDESTGNAGFATLSDAPAQGRDVMYATAVRLKAGYSSSEILATKDDLEADDEDTACVRMVKTPLGLGLSVDADNIVTDVATDSQASRSGEIAPQAVLGAARRVALPHPPLSALFSTSAGQRFLTD